MKDNTDQIQTQTPAADAATPAPTGAVDQTQLNMWRNRYRRVFTIEVMDFGERHVGYFHRPDMEILAATNKLSKTDEIKAVDVLFTNCWLGGSALIQEEAVIKMAVMAKFNQVVAVQHVELKNS